MLNFVKVVCCGSGPITSKANSRVKHARKVLTNRRVREREGLIFVEGIRLVLDAVAAKNEPEVLFFTDRAMSKGEYGAAMQKLISTLPHDRVVYSSEEIMQHLTDTENCQGVAAVLKKKQAIAPAQPSLVLALDRLSDPGNVGTLIRTAAGAGAHAVFLTKGSADPFGLKTLRAGMGAQFRIPVLPNWEWSDIESYSRERGLALIVADGSGDVRHYSYDWKEPSMLVVGAEADGPSEEVLKSADCCVSIPLAEDSAESLNAAVAGAVILFEAQRQRIVG
ncbi:hypothetical protein NDN08_004496 [Rhodosorus marinus]|uniref:RNA 2-O ribose methyltransferase substrate binding domain-containing protein n=1 Tax=Rhodosorus marinus TaxID=101924 RepID=A0AAV8UP70_9RHOD|nr:hypothetical protein NDN08_004496 [Rhodosorus marinus]